VLAVGLLGLAACSRASADDPLGYLAATKNRIAFVEWNVSSASPSATRKVTGTATLATIDHEKFTLTTDLAPFTGTLDGSSVALTMARALDSATSWTGTLSGSQLTLSYTDGTGTLVTLNLQSATRSAFSAAIITQQQALQGRESNSASNKTEAQLQADIDKWAKVVSQDMATLDSEVAAVAAAVPPISAASSSAEAFRSTAHDALVHAKKHQYGPQICPFADEATANANSASGAAGSASAANDRLNALVATAKKQITKLTADHGSLTSAQAALPSYKPPGVPTDKEVSDFISSSNSSVTDSVHTGNGASRTAGNKASSAQSDASEARSVCAQAPQENPSPKPSPS
jgi:hypothetical protein